MKSTHTTSGQLICISTVSVSNFLVVNCQWLLKCSVLQKNKFIWQTSDPVGFQLWKNRNFRNPHPPSYVIKLKPSNVLHLHGIEPKLSFYTTLLNSTRTTLYPETGNMTLCGAMLLTNLADPEWVTIGCNKPVTLDVICFFEKSLNAFVLNDTTLRYDKSCVHRNKSCHIFRGSHSSGQRTKLQRKSLWNIRIFQFLFDAVGATFPPIELYPSSLAMKYTKLGSLYKYHVNEETTSSPERLQVFMQHHLILEEGENIYKCNNTYWSILFVCDHLEALSLTEGKCMLGETSPTVCKTSNNDSSTLRCLDLYVKLVDNKCSPVDWDNTHWIQGPHAGDEDDVPGVQQAQKIDDLHCDDESACQNANCGHGTRVDSVIVGNQTSQLSCRAGFPACYNISKICSYQLDELSHLVHCRGGEHLENCKDFECNMMYKCPKYFCIPWSYVCDHKWDCPQGFEEQNCRPTRTCEGLYKCKQSHTCIHLNDVCNGVTDCPLKEDESLCSLSGIVCPVGCKCLMFALFCHNLRQITVSCIRLPFHVVTIKESKAQPFRMLLGCITFFSVLAIGHNNIDTLCSHVPSTQHAVIVDAGFNQISKINSGCFHESPTLTIVRLNNNNLTHIDTFAFNMLKSLAVLDLSFNKISVLPGCWKGTDKIQVLLLHGNRIELSEDNVITSEKLKYLKGDKYSLCCSLSPVRCLVEKPWFFSCTDLLPGLNIKISFYLESLFVIVFSGTSQVLRVQELYKNKFHHWAFGSTVFAVNAVDITCGVYLTIISVQDAISDNMFALHESEWKSSSLCFLEFAVLLNFNLLSPILLSFCH